MKRTLLALLPLLVLAAPAPVQERKSNPDVKGGAVEAEAPEDARTESAPPPASRPGNARNHCELIPAIVPARIPPGGSGTLVVTMALKGDMVLMSPPPVTFQIQPQQGSLTLGQPSFRPASEARLAPAFLGQRVYDNCAVFDVPFTVDGGAAHGKLPILVPLTFVLHVGKTGNAVRELTDLVRAEVEVGDPVPQFAAPRGARAAGAQPVAPERTAEAEPKSAPAPTAGDRPTPQAAPRVRPVAEPPPAPAEGVVPGTGGTATATEGSNVSLLALLGLAAVLGLLGLLLAVRRK